MKVIISEDSCGKNAWHFIRTGWARALDLSEHDVFLWDCHSLPAIDLFDSRQADLFIGQSYNLNRGLVKALSEHPETRVVLQAGDWSPWSDKIDSNKYPILKASKKEIESVKELQSKRPIDLIFAHYHPNDIQKTHETWTKEFGIPLTTMSPGLDVVDYVEGKSLPEFECDIVHISGYWPYKSQNINKYFLPLCEDTSLRIKIFGNRGWPGANYMGELDTKYVKHAFKSAKLNINISEPHAILFDSVEVNEKCFKLLGGKNQVLSTPDNSLMNNFFTNGEIEYALNEREFQRKARAFVAGDLTIDVEKGYHSVMNEHTYFHRVSSLFSSLKMEDEARHVLARFSELRKVNNI